MAETLTLAFPITKFSQEQRTVTGIATSEALDKDGEVIDFEASVKAFSGFLGNIREMHDNIAVGKMLSWQALPDKSIEVTVYVSKGAEPTWLKVQDGTLRGFSIGGLVSKRKANRILEYSLAELSLVDNPANPQARFSLVKAEKTNQLAKYKYRLRLLELTGV